MAAAVAAVAPSIERDESITRTCVQRSVKQKLSSRDVGGGGGAGGGVTKIERD